MTEIVEHRIENVHCILGSWESPEVQEKIKREYGTEFPLVIADPPYGRIVSEEWDRVSKIPSEYATQLVAWAKLCEGVMADGAALYYWGGIGMPGYRPFVKFLDRIEAESGLTMSTLVTWKKKRAYGIQWGYLFVREECAYLVKGNPKKPRKFQVPYLDKLRGYKGYDPMHPAKDDRLRRTNVWDDQTEILQGKYSPTEKPRQLAAMMIETHTELGEVVLDPFAGSGSTALAARKLKRKCVLVEKCPKTYARMVARMEDPFA